MNYFGSVFI